MDYNQNAKLAQAIVLVVERTRLAMNLAASSDRETTVILKYKDGGITFAVTIGDER